MFDKDDIQTKLFQDDKTDTKAELFTCDIPCLHIPSDEKCIEFYDRLLAHGNEDLDLYKSQALKTYTNFNWPLVKDHVIWQEFIPHIVYMIAYIFYALCLYDFEHPMFHTN